MLKPLKFRLIAIVLIVVLIVIEVSAAPGDSQTIDEGAHLASGYSYWLTGSFQLNPEHPPLVKLLSGAMLLPLGLDFPSEQSGWLDGNQWEFSRQLIYHNTKPFKTLLFLGRLPNIVLLVALACLILIWTKRLFGPLAGLFSLSLFIIDPNFLAHGRLITTDVPAALFFTLTIFTFLRYLEKPGSLNVLLIFILSFTGAQLTKFSALLLWFIIILLYLIAWWRSSLETHQTDRHLAKYSMARLCKMLAALFFISLFLIWMSYGFSVKKPIDLNAVQAYYQSQHEQIISGQSPAASPSVLVGNIMRIDRWPGRWLESLAQTVPVPALEYFQGAILVAQHNYYGHSAYLLGQAGSLGWWYYFPVAFFVKSPGPIVILFVALLIIMLIPFFRHFSRGLLNILAWLKTLPMWIYGLVLPPLIYFIVSIFGHINLGVRHLMPVYPFVYIGIGYLVYRFSRGRRARLLLGGLLIFAYAMAGFTYPNHLSYFSEFIGGPSQGHHYLLDSNLDWGQGYYALQAYISHNPPTKYYGSFFGSIDFSALGLPDIRNLPTDEEFLSTGPPLGTVLISASVLYDPNMRYTWLRNYHPVSKLRGSIYVFKF